jgi:hypothetical protein
VVTSSIGKASVELDIDANVRVEIDQRGNQTLVFDDDKVEVRIPIPAARGGQEYPYLLVRMLATRVEREADRVKRNTLAWHGPVNGPGGWV